MRYVLDSCVGFKWAVIEADTAKARRLRDDFRMGVHELLAPDIFPVEIAHAMSRAERQGRVAPAQGGAFLLSILQTPPLLLPYLPLLPRAYAISSQMRVGVYDCLYVALAEREGCPFITSDDKLVKNLQPSFPFIVALSTMP